MKTNEQILERYLSQESVDFFGTQRQILLCLLPYKMAKPYLDENYVMQHDNDTLPEDERWLEDADVKQQILDFLPGMYAFVYKGDTVSVTQGMAALKAWLWVYDEPFLDELLSEINDHCDDRDILQMISTHIGYTPIIEDIAFEELPKDN